MPFPHNNLGRDEIIKCYDLNELTDIANNGCANCAPHSHHLYKDTIHFFSKHEAEILTIIEEQYGMSELYKLFEKSQACYDMYRNECTWLFIETVAQDVVNQLEQIAEDEEQLIMEYMKPIDNNPVDITNVIGMNSGLNHEKSMNLNRYSQV
tara:strand:- start:181 stop:636 length:456 start_codon:yes stop_codon:yes gene_type:complete